MLARLLRSITTTIELSLVDPTGRPSTLPLSSSKETQYHGPGLRAPRLFSMRFWGMNVPCFPVCGQVLT